MLTRVAQIVATAHRDLKSCMYRSRHTNNYVSLTYFTGENRPPEKVDVNSHLQVSCAHGMLVTDILRISFRQKYMGIIVVPNYIFTPCFNFRYCVVTEQSYREKA